MRKLALFPLIALTAVLCLSCFVPTTAQAGGTLIQDKVAHPIQFVGPSTVEVTKATRAASTAGYQTATFAVSGLGLIEFVSTVDTYLYLNGVSPGYLIKANTYKTYAVPAKLTTVAFTNASTATAPTVYLIKHK